jgi:SAM-dependent methyltransferase
MAAPSTFEELVAEGASAPVAGWDFGWLDGRASEERPSWGYSRMVSERMITAAAALDVQTGGGEVLAGIGQRPPLLAAVESWPPNVEVAGRTLRPLGIWVLAADHAALPFRDSSFDLVISRHPVDTCWPEIARVLRPGGTFLSQQIGAGTVRELAEAISGPLPPAAQRQRIASVTAAAEAAGLIVVDLRHEALRTVFNDIAAVVYFLRKVVWTVPDFTVERYRDRLVRLHERIQAEGPFVAHAQRFLIEARKPRQLTARRSSEASLRRNSS